MTQQEQQLIQRAADGDNAAFESLVTQYEKLVYSVDLSHDRQPRGCHGPEPGDFRQGLEEPEIL